MSRATATIALPSAYASSRSGPSATASSPTYWIARPAPTDGSRPSTTPRNWRTTSASPAPHSRKRSVKWYARDSSPSKVAATASLPNSSSDRRWGEGYLSRKTSPTAVLSSKESPQSPVNLIRQGLLFFREGLPRTTVYVFFFRVGLPRTTVHAAFFREDRPHGSFRDIFQNAQLFKALSHSISRNTIPPDLHFRAYLKIHSYPKLILISFLKIYSDPRLISHYSSKYIAIRS